MRAVSGFFRHSTPSALAWASASAYADSTMTGMSAHAGSARCAARKAVAVHAGHHQVEQDHARRLGARAELGERVESVARAERGVAEVLEHLDQAVADIAVVVDDEHGVRHRRAHAARPGVAIGSRTVKHAPPAARFFALTAPPCASTTRRTT
jgi:hypothetical protein